MWSYTHQPTVILAPMDGYTDPPFRRFIKRIEPRAIVFSEFLSATEVAKKPALADRLFQIWPDEHPVVIQLYGKDPAAFVTAAGLAQARGAAGIDLNMGCPARKVVAHQHGSALMKNIDLACAIVGAVKSAVRIPVSVKTRLGWDDSENLIPFTRQLVDAGLDAITIHGRTYRQRFDGHSDWNPIYALKQQVPIPVFGNGDITDGEAAVARLGNLDGVMVGRAITSDPFVMREICDHLNGGPIRPRPAIEEQLADWSFFAAETIGMGDESRMARRLRKFLIKLVRRHQPNHHDLLNQAKQVRDMRGIDLVLKGLVEPVDCLAG